MAKNRNGLQNPLISIIVPAYCVENYLKPCLESLCAQTYDNIEILVVVTASVDRTEEVAQEYALLDKRIKMIRGEVRGVSASRNKALEMAKGTYIAFVDADDYVSDKYIEILHNQIRENDMAVCGFARVREEAEKEECLYANRDYDKNQLLQDVLCDNRIGGYLWNKLFVAEIIKKNDLYFDIDLSVGEDMFFLAEYVQYIEKASYSKEILYYYRVNENSALQKMYTTGVFEMSKMSNMLAARKIQELLMNEDEVVKEAASYRMVRTGMWLLFNLLKCNYYDRSILQEIKRNMKGNLRAYLSNAQTKTLEKIVAVCVWINPEVFWRMATFSLKRLPEALVRHYVN